MSLATLALALGCGGRVASLAPDCEPPAPAQEAPFDAAVMTDAPGDSVEPIAEASVFPPAAGVPPEPPTCSAPPDPGTSCGSGECVVGARTRYPHAEPIVTKLTDGRVMVLGGGDYSRVAEIYDPKCDSWTVAAPARGPHRGERDSLSVVLADGRVLFVSGFYDGTLYETYDPVANAWGELHVLKGSRPNIVVALDGARVALLLGCSARVLDTTSGAVTDVANPTAPEKCSSYGAATIAPNRALIIGRSLDVVGGGATVTNFAWIFDGMSFRAVANPPLVPAVASEPVVRLADGRVLVTGDLESAVYDAATDAWSSIALTARRGTVTQLPCGKLLSIGDYDSTTRLDVRAVVDPVTLTRVPLAPVHRRIQHGAALLNDGRALIVGGYGMNGSRLSVELCR